MNPQEFVEGLEKFLCMLRRDERFDGLELKRGGDTSLKLVWRDILVGTVSHEGGAAFFDPRVAYAPPGTKIEGVFADWAGAALRRAKQDKLENRQ